MSKVATRLVNKDVDTPITPHTLSPAKAILIGPSIPSMTRCKMHELLAFSAAVTIHIRYPQCGGMVAYVPAVKESITMQIL